MSDGKVAKDLLAGTAGGIAQVLVGQPFDIVKVRLQSSSSADGPLEVARLVAREGGPLAFYKGTTMPLVGIGACVSLQFAFLEAAKRAITDGNKRAGRSAELSLPQLYLAGAIAGLGNSVASGPVEHIRIRLQTQTAAGPDAYRGPFDAIKRIYAADGLRGIYQGQVATILRELHGYGMYFACYEYLVQRRCQQTQTSRSQLPTSAAVLYGVAAGWTMWATAYPLDVIKSRIQTDGFHSQPERRKYRGIGDCAAQIWRDQGAKGFLRGLTPTLIRSPFVNGATFAVYEVTRQALG